MPRENPLLLPVPEDRIDRVHALARDLAYGVAEGVWDSYIHIFRDELSVMPRKESELIRNFKEKWSGKNEVCVLLETFGYSAQTGDMTFKLTGKAFALLESPAAPPSIFISYKTKESAALALLIEARLKVAGNPNPFLDKAIEPGEAWLKRLETQIENCQCLVVCLGEKAAQSDYVKQEIEWALEKGKRIIPICLPGFSIAASGIHGLTTTQAIQVMGERALDYEAAVNALLNALGYQTY